MSVAEYSQNNQLVGVHRRVPPLWQAASLLVPIAVLTGLVLRLQAVPPPPALDARTTQKDERFGLTAAERRAIFADIAGHDAEWQGLAARFTDAWSRHDDYHIHLSRHVQALASTRKLPVEVVFLIYDEGVRRHWVDAAGKTLEATWVPLLPRTQ